MSGIQYSERRQLNGTSSHENAVYSHLFLKLMLVIRLPSTFEIESTVVAAGRRPRKTNTMLTNRRGFGVVRTDAGLGKDSRVL